MTIGNQSLYPQISSNFFCPIRELLGKQMTIGKQTKFEAQMTTAIDDLAKKLDGFDAAMTKVLDKLTVLEAWKSTANASMDKLLVSSWSVLRPSSTTSSRCLLSGWCCLLRHNHHCGGPTRLT